MLRITGGIFRGRMIRTPARETTRPTQSMLRQALFNSIQMRIPEARVLDLFAGSGALGFEALSRGAAEAVFVENASGPLKCIKENIETLKVEEQTRVLGFSVERAWADLEARKVPFDIVLADPPYGKGWEQKLLDGFPWAELLAPEGVVLIEWSPEKAGKGETPGLPTETAFLVKIREKNYGDSVLTTYQRRPS